MICVEISRLLLTNQYLIKVVPVWWIKAPTRKIVGMMLTSKQSLQMKNVNIYFTFKRRIKVYLSYSYIDICATIHPTCLGSTQDCCRANRAINSSGQTPFYILAVWLVLSTQSHYPKLHCIILVSDGRFCSSALHHYGEYSKLKFQLIIYIYFYGHWELTLYYTFQTSSWVRD